MFVTHPSLFWGTLLQNLTYSHQLSCRIPISGLVAWVSCLQGKKLSLNSYICHLKCQLLHVFGVRHACNVTQCTTWTLLDEMCDVTIGHSSDSVGRHDLWRVVTICILDKKGWKLAMNPYGAPHVLIVALEGSGYFDTFGFDCCVLVGKKEITKK